MVSGDQPGAHCHMLCDVHLWMLSNLQDRRIDCFCTTGDGVISRDELKQFVRSSRMTELDDEEFDILFRSGDTDQDGSWSYGEVVDYLDSLLESHKEDFRHSIKKFLKNGSDEELATLWSKMDLNGDGVVSMEELAIFVTSETAESSSSSDDIASLLGGIDSDGNGIISFHEFESYLHAARTSTYA